MYCDELAFTVVLSGKVIVHAYELMEPAPGDVTVIITPIGVHPSTLFAANTGACANSVQEVSNSAMLEIIRRRKVFLALISQI